MTDLDQLRESLAGTRRAVNGAQRSVGLLGAVGIVLALSFDRLRTGSHLVERLLGALCYASLQETGFAQGTWLQYNINWLRDTSILNR